MRTSDLLTPLFLFSLYSNSIIPHFVVITVVSIIMTSRYCLLLSQGMYYDYTSMVFFIFSQLNYKIFIFPFPGFISSLCLSFPVFSNSCIECSSMQFSTQPNLSDNLSVLFFFSLISLSWSPPLCSLLAWFFSKTAEQISFWGLSSIILEFPLLFSWARFPISLIQSFLFQ